MGGPGRLMKVQIRHVFKELKTFSQPSRGEQIDVDDLIEILEMDPKVGVNRIFKNYLKILLK